MALVGCTGSLNTGDAGTQPAGDGGVVHEGDSATSMPDAGPTCPADDSSALVMDGVDDHVSLGVVPELGLAQFTIEAWVRRDGPGEEAGTGVNGIKVVPIVSKGRGERDGENVDTNYAFGFVGDVIGADFEDMADGGNHPVVGRTPIALGEWHHVAVTYDGASWVLYVDGLRDRMKAANATPRADSIQQVAIGTTFNSEGAADGAFHGAIDHVRIWDHARSATEIAASVYAAPASLDGLLAGYEMDESEGSTVRDVTGMHDGTIETPMYTAPGAPVGLGAPPAGTSAAPADEASVTGESVDLAVEVTDPDSDHFTVTYYARPITEAEDFTIAVLPDTQNYTRDDSRFSGFEHLFYGQTEWIMENKEAYNIVAVLHNGDVINNWDQRRQWEVADRAMATLEEESEFYPDGMPVGIAIGNHDIRGGTEVFNEWFGLDRYEHRVYYGGHYRGGNNDSFITFTGGGLKFVAVNLKWDETPSPALHAWVRQVFDSHPEAFGILNTHYLLNRTGWGAQGTAIYDDLKDVQNLHLMTSGHVTDERLVSRTHEGHTIHTMLADYQSFGDRGGEGYFRIWEFSPANNELTVRTYSPDLDNWQTDADSEFTLEVDLSGAGADFARVGVVEVDGGTATITMSGLAAGTIYEWYATVQDCSHTARTGIRRFSTM